MTDKVYLSDFFCDLRNVRLNWFRDARTFSQSNLENLAAKAFEIINLQEVGLNSLYNYAVQNYWPLTIATSCCGTADTPFLRGPTGSKIWVQRYSKLQRRLTRQLANPLGSIFVISERENFWFWKSLNSYNTSSY